MLPPNFGRIPGAAGVLPLAKILDMATAEDVARWMLEEVSSKGYLEQEAAFFEIETRFGEGFTYMNESGGNSIDKKVLRAFNKISGDEVVWARVSRYWRPRQAGDGPSRAQYE